jgi:hypothetical protein
MGRNTTRESLLSTNPARFWPFLALISLGLLGLLLNTRRLFQWSRVSKQTTLIVSDDIELVEFQCTIVLPTTKHSATVVFLHAFVRRLEEHLP